MPPIAQEVEIKLSVQPEHAPRLWGVLARHPHGKPVSRRVFSAYYDTPDRQLQAAGVALRLRRVRDHWIQTIKSGGTAGAGLHRRAEQETTLPAQLPSFPAMIEAGFGELVADRRTREAIQVAFNTDFRRSSTLISPRAGTSIEVCLDRGEIVAAGRSSPICEIELELKSGATVELIDLALEIARGMSVRLEGRSKAQRGYALAADAQPEPVKASTVPICADMTVEHAFVTIAYHCLAHLQENEAGLIAGHDPEYLHQARVALRRLRSAFRVFDAAISGPHFVQLLDELKSLTRALGAARDLDVFSGETLAQAGSADHAGISALRRRTQDARERTARAAQSAVEAPEFTAMQLRMARALEAGQWRSQMSRETRLSLLKFARKSLSHRYARVRKNGSPITRLGFAQLHRLRIRVKRFRYSIEFFLPLFANDTHATLRALSELQAMLGRFTDDATAWRLLDALATEDLSPDYQQAVGYVRGWCARDAEQCRSRLQDAWKRFEALQPWWKSL